MSLKVESQTSKKLPRKTSQKITSVIASLPSEHLIGIERIRIVDAIDDNRLTLHQKTSLPGLYHPRQGSQRAWLEVNATALLPSDGGFFKKLIPRIAFYNNLSAILVSLVGQHYYISLRHSAKKGSLESSVRSYTTKHLKGINKSEHKLRAKIFAPLQPTLERLAKSLNAKARKRTSR